MQLHSRLLAKWSCPSRFRRAAGLNLQERTCGGGEKSGQGRAARSRGKAQKDTSDQPKRQPRTHARVVAVGVQAKGVWRSRGKVQAHERAAPRQPRTTVADGRKLGSTKLGSTTKSCPRRKKGNATSLRPRNGAMCVAPTPEPTRAQVDGSKQNARCWRRTALRTQQWLGSQELAA